MSCDFYVYMLAYPDGTVFYIGKGIGDRILHHERDARNGVQSSKCDIIRSIWNTGGQMMRIKVLEGLSEKEALIFEAYFIETHRIAPVRRIANKVIPSTSKRERQIIEQKAYSALPTSATISGVFSAISACASTVLRSQGIVFDDMGATVDFPAHIKTTYDQHEDGSTVKRFHLDGCNLICLSTKGMLDVEQV